MEKSAILHFQNGEFCYKVGENEYLFKIITKKNDVEVINLIYHDKYLFGHHEYGYKRELAKMEKVASNEISDYYEVRIKVLYPAIKYLFELCNGDEKLYYGNSLFYDSEPNDKNLMFNAITYILDDEYFAVPRWSQNAVYYQIFPERFNPTDEACEDWYKVPMDFRTRTNGSLYGIVKKLDYLKSLGVDCIYINPIFLANSSHRYDTVDYMQVDPLLGGDLALHSLVEEAHKKDIKVILDIAYNHTSTHFFAFEDLLKKQENSKYKDWYFPFGFPVSVDLLKYKCFAYFPFMPKLNTQNPEVKDYLMKVTKRYLEDFQIDGYRLDVCDEISHHFWREFRQVVKQINPNAIIIGEIWYDSTLWLKGDECDTVMNYTVLTGIKDLINRKIKIIDFVNLLGKERGTANLNYYFSTLNMVSTHDTKRVYREVGCDKAKFKLALGLNFLLPGSTLLYYGDEVMMDGDADPDCRRGMIFDINMDITDYVRRLVMIKKQLGTSEIQNILITDDLYAFSRGEFIVILNLGTNSYENTFDRWDLISDSEFMEIAPLSIYVVKKMKKQG